MNDLVRKVRRWLLRRKTDKDLDRLRAAHVGVSSYIDPSVHVLGWKNVRVGHHTTVSADVWINVNDRESDSPAVVIGNSCFIGRRNFLSSGARIQLGDYCLTGVDCHFLGADHVYTNPFVPYVSTGTTLDEVIEIGANCWLGASVTVLAGVRIGFGSIIGAGAVVTRDVPPFSVAVGNPACVIKRFDVGLNQWVPAGELSAQKASQLPSESEYLAALMKTHPAVKGPRVASSKTFGDL